MFYIPQLRYQKKSNSGIVLTKNLIIPISTQEKIQEMQWKRPWCPSTWNPETPPLSPGGMTGYQNLHSDTERNKHPPNIVSCFYKAPTVVLMHLLTVYNKFTSCQEKKKPRKLLTRWLRRILPRSSIKLSNWKQKVAAGADNKCCSKWKTRLRASVINNTWSTSVQLFNVFNIDLNIHLVE